MQTYLNVAQIVLAVALVLIILFQVRGGGLGGIFGQPDTVYRTKRGGRSFHHRRRNISQN
jgi:preprotein translocase subunit SecG